MAHFTLSEIFPGIPKWFSVHNAQQKFLVSTLPIFPSASFTGTAAISLYLFSVVAVTNDHKTSDFLKSPLLIWKPKVQQAWLGILLGIRLKSRCQLAWILSGSSGAESASRFIQVVRSIQCQSYQREVPVSLLAVDMGLFSASRGGSHSSTPGLLYLKANGWAPWAPSPSQASYLSDLSFCFIFPSSLLPRLSDSFDFKGSGDYIGPI